MNQARKDHTVYMRWTIVGLSIIFIQMKQVDYKKNFGRLLREMRLAEDLSQEAFADKFEINRTYYGKVERGENSISIDKLQNISIKLDKPLSELMKLAEEL